MNPPNKAAAAKPKESYEYLETPFLIRQTEGHLIFGPLSRHIPAAYFFCVVIWLISAGTYLWAQHLHDKDQREAREAARAILNSMASLGLILISVGVSMTKRQQAILLWIITKFILGLMAFLMVMGVALPNFIQGKTSAWLYLFLGLIWLPGPEFLPKINSHQRYATLARIVLSIPVVYFGVRSGEWFR